MRKKFIVIGLILLTLVGCNVKEDSQLNTTIKPTNTAIKPTSTGTGIQEPLVNPTPTTAHATNKPIPSIQPNVKELGESDLKKYLNMRKDEFIKQVDANAELGTIAVMESSMVFPELYSNKLGMSLIYPSKAENAMPLYISVVAESNTRNINVKGAKAGMKFNEIKSLLGDLEIASTWTSNKSNVQYKLSYNQNSLTYTFVSNDSEGSYSELYIALE